MEYISTQITFSHKVIEGKSGTTGGDDSTDISNTQNGHDLRTDLLHSSSKSVPTLLLL